MSSKIIITRMGVVVKGQAKQWSGYLGEIKKQCTTGNESLVERIDSNAANLEKDFESKICQTNEIISALNNQIGQVQISLAFIMKQLKERPGNTKA